MSIVRQWSAVNNSRVKKRSARLNHAKPGMKACTLFDLRGCVCQVHTIYKVWLVRSLMIVFVSFSFFQDPKTSSLFLGQQIACHEHHVGKTGEGGQGEENAEDFESMGQQGSLREI